MDDRSFDRLARVVSDLRDRTSRRGALKALLGGALAVPALAADDAEAEKRKNRKNRDKWWNGNRCRSYGQPCSSNRQCCNGDCWYGICRTGQPGKQCGFQTCLPGYECCRDSFGGSICTLPGYGVCCNNGSNWNGNYKCCNGGACFSGWTCCGNGSCCPPGLRCRNGSCTTRSGARNASAQRAVPAVAPDPADSVTLAPGEGEA